MAIKIIDEKCIGCSKCVRACPYDAVEVVERKAKFKPSCTECGACVGSCPTDAIELLKDSGSKMDITLYKGIMVFAEQREGKLKKVSIELLGRARELAADLGCGVSAALVGYKVEGLAAELIARGADKVYCVDDAQLERYTTTAYTKAMVTLIIQLKPEIVLYGATHVGRDLAPRVARRLGTGLTADCTELTIEKEKRLLQQTRPAFGGNVMATIWCQNHRPQMSTVRPGIMKEHEPDPSRKGEVVRVKVELKPDDLKTKVVEVVKEVRKVANLEDAKIIVSGGRGVGGKEGFKTIQLLADALGAEVGGSRVAVEKGWISKDHQVGQTGKTVRPKLYVACGISGSIQHRAGMSNSGLIVAINKDPNAQIFSIADIGVVADLHEFIPKFVEELKRQG
jgi:electron transfer flavoprotein alpha subunit/NAD-dependent dihydropyrimidine dehydrogenase PreA subunit